MTDPQQSEAPSLERCAAIADKLAEDTILVEEDAIQDAVSVILDLIGRAREAEEERDKMLICIGEHVHRAGNLEVENAKLRARVSALEEAGRESVDALQAALFKLPHAPRFANCAARLEIALQMSRTALSDSTEGCDMDRETLDATGEAEKTDG